MPKSPKKKAPARSKAKHRTPSARKENSARTNALIAKGKRYYTLNYKPREIILDRGKGAKLWDAQGNDYIDFGAGIAVNSLGYSNPLLVRALAAQGKKIWHTSAMFYSEPTILLAEELVRVSGFAKRVFFCNSGAEANEAAIKLARKYSSIHHADKPEKREIITFTGSFHGRTMATVTATAQPKYQQGFEPLPGGFIYANFNDIEDVKRKIGPRTCAVLSEVVQGEGGITPVKPGFLRAVQELCHKHDALLMLDQVQCGMGRTGHLFSHFAEEGVVPDVVSVAKGLGGGIPIGATLVGEKVQDVFQFGSHGSTFGGNPLASAVARVVLQQLQSKRLMQNVAARGKQIREALDQLQKHYNLFQEIRGRGLMIGAELKPEFHGKAGDFCDAARLQGLLVLQAGPNVLRFLPPLVITQAEVRLGLQRLEAGIISALHTLRG